MTYFLNFIDKSFVMDSNVTKRGRFYLSLQKTMFFSQALRKDFKCEGKDFVDLHNVTNCSIKIFVILYRNIYKKCSKCGTILKLPLQTKAGFKKAKCPKCNKKVRLFTFKKEKIEIIRGGVK